MVYKLATVLINSCNKCPNYRPKGERKGHGFRRTSLCELLDIDPDPVPATHITPIPDVCPLNDIPKEIKEAIYGKETE